MASPHAVVGFSLNPITWLGGAAASAASDVWKDAMVFLWSAGLWLLKVAFTLIDGFTTPDLSPTGPLHTVIPTMLWLGGFVAGVTFFLQLGAALIRQDGKGLGRVLIGGAQLSVVWVSYLTMGALMVTAASGLTHGLLSSLLHVDNWQSIDTGASWPRSVDDATVATVLGIVSFLLLIPSAFAYLMIMLVREAGLLILICTAPITAAGLMNETTSAWFWKSLRWFIACVLMAPTCALVLGIGTAMSSGVIDGSGDQTVAAVGMAVVGAVVQAIGAVCPIALFKLLAFVEPGTASGAALRQSWSDAGGMAGVLSGKGGETSPAGNSAATADSGDGRSAGEAAAEGQTSSRMMGALGALGQGMQAAGRVAGKASELGADVLGGAGVGHPGYAAGYADQQAERAGQRGGGGKSAAEESPAATPVQSSSDNDDTTPPAPPGPTGGGGGGGGSPLPGGDGTPGTDGTDGLKGDTGPMGPAAPQGAGAGAVPAEAAVVAL